jgi:outer membrane lipoprotein-sorting protein
MKIFLSRIVLILSIALSCAWAQTAGQDMKKAGEDTKDATKTAAQGTGKAVKTGVAKTTHASKTVTHKAAKKVDEGAQKTEDKTR